MLVCAEISIHKKEKNAAKENEITVNLLQFVFVKSSLKLHITMEGGCNSAGFLSCPGKYV